MDSCLSGLIDLIKKLLSSSFFNLNHYHSKELKNLSGSESAKNNIILWFCNFKFISN